MVNIDKKLISIGAMRELARRSFWWYCKLKAPSFYKDDRPYLKQLCDDMEQFCNSDYDVLIVNMPP